MRLVEIYIGTSLRGSAKGTGKVLYMLRSKRKNGEDHEKKAITERDDATESHLVLYGLRDALRRTNFACEVVVYTECAYVAAAINNKWYCAWQENNWQNGRKKPVKDADLWRDILEVLEDTGHEMSAKPGKNEFSAWMQGNIPRIHANKDTFTDIEEITPNLVSDKM